MLVGYNLQRYNFSSVTFPLHYSPLCGGVTIEQSGWMRPCKLLLHSGCAYNFNRIWKQATLGGLQWEEHRNTQKKLVSLRQAATQEARSSEEELGVTTLVSLNAHLLADGNTGANEQKYEDINKNNCH